MFGVQLYKNNARAILSRILSILNLDWLQHARSVCGVYECTLLTTTLCRHRCLWTRWTFSFLPWSSCSNCKVICSIRFQTSHNSWCQSDITDFHRVKVRCVGIYGAYSVFDDVSNNWPISFHWYGPSCPSYYHRVWSYISFRNGWSTVKHWWSCTMKQ